MSLDHDPEQVLAELEKVLDKPGQFVPLPPLPDLPSLAPPRAGERVTIGTPHLDSFGANYVDSVLRMISYDKVRGNHLMHDSGLQRSGAVCMAWGRGIELAHVRNTMAAAFLSSESEWLLWVDSDMGFEPDALEKLMAVAHPEAAPIVGGLCFIETDFGHDWRGGLTAALQPTLYDWAWLQPSGGLPGRYKLIPRADWPAREMIRVGATGTGFLLVHRSVFDRISQWLREQGAPPNIWFERIPGPDGEMCGEDVSFCLRAHQVDIPVHVHTGVVTNHQKSVWYSTPHYRERPFTPPKIDARVLLPEEWPKLMVNRNAAEQAAADSPIRARQVPYATESVAIIVPVAKRDRAAGFLESLRVSLRPEQHSRVAVHVMADKSDADTFMAWVARRGLYPNVHVHRDRYPTEMGTFAQKVNVGYRRATAGGGPDWLFLTGDDVFFHPGWLDQAMHVAREAGAQVVGTNDGGNPKVLSGEHAVHFFLNRRYVESLGASWDGPGVVAHEGYQHWYVDNEIITVAKQRGVWEPCLESRVEHLHPYWGKAEMDDTYRTAERFAELDGEWWERRRARYDGSSDA